MTGGHKTSVIDLRNIPIHVLLNLCSGCITSLFSCCSCDGSYVNYSPIREGYKLITTNINKETCQGEPLLSPNSPFIQDWVLSPFLFIDLCPFCQLKIMKANKILGSKTTIGSLEL